MEVLDHNIPSTAPKDKKVRRILDRIGKFCEVLTLSIVFLIITGLFSIPTIFYVNDAIQVSHEH